MVIVTAGHGHLLGLWRLRLWFVYTVVCMCLRDYADNLISRLVPVGPTLHSLTPKATIFGYIVGGIVAFAFYFNVSETDFNLTFFCTGGQLNDQLLVVQREPNQAWPLSF